MPTPIYSRNGIKKCLVLWITALHPLSGSFWSAMLPPCAPSRCCRPLPLPLRVPFMPADAAICSELPAAFATSISLHTAIAARPPSNSRIVPEILRSNFERGSEWPRLVEFFAFLCV